jgi:hypothetical protein
VHPAPDPLLLRKSVCAWNRTQSSSSVVRSSDHWSTVFNKIHKGRTVVTGFVIIYSDEH